jgi:Fur family ferric uptake transcriptional regulator
MAGPDVLDWQQLLRDKGYRLTPQRELVLSAVNRLGHATPDEILTAVRRTARGVNVSTVYRTLELLEQIGLVRHTHLIDTATTYHLAADQHFHLVCRMCRTVSEAPTGMLAELAGRLADERGFSMDVGHVALFGVCGNCSDGNTCEPDAAAHSGSTAEVPEVLS